MTKEKLAGFLGIDKDNIQQAESKFEVSDIEIGKIDRKLWLEEIEIEFWRCNFVSVVNFTNLSISTKLMFSDCIFNKFFTARSTVIENEIKFYKCIFQDIFDCNGTKQTVFKKDFTCVACDFDGKASFTNAEFQGRVNFKVSRFKNETRFIKTKFQAQATDSETVENNFREVHFEGKTIFTDAEFQGRVNFSISRFKNEARFIETKFLAKDSKTIENNFNEAQFETVLFRQIDFKGRVSFEKNNFKKSTFRKITFSQVKITFWESEFERVSFIDCIFPYQTKFDRCIFKNTLFQNQKETNPMFQDIKFQDCVFKETNTFGEKVFLIESKPLLTTNTFEGQFNINHQYLHYQLEEIPRENISVWRDLFRRLKSNRLAYHNLIDATELHTQELYARELELGQKGRGIRDKIEKWQLFFYRLTSDHHTDLAKIFNNVILLIALFGIFAFGSIKYREKHLDYERQYFGSVGISAIDLSIRKTSHSLTKSDLKAERQDLQNLSWNQNNFSESFSIAILCLAFVMSFMGLISLDCLKNKFWIKARNIFSYLLVFGVLVLKPTLLLPFVGRFLESSLTASFPAMQSLSVVYCILMFLMLFSLQKTARKNSIIPS